ncbi:hypothetical protein [Streptomyces sp. DG1A-41]|uniref:hypothetical protein n=1 Tax=Streptomyces sp. DG1A-41 TaxID=3125779 RepID=UPI0030D1CACD
MFPVVTPLRLRETAGAMTAFVIAALRGDMDDEAQPAHEPDPTATAAGRGQPPSP